MREFYWYQNTLGPNKILILNRLICTYQHWNDMKMLQIYLAEMKKQNFCIVKTRIADLDQGFSLLSLANDGRNAW